MLALFVKSVLCFKLKGIKTVVQFHLTNHSMARANLNKSKKVLTSTTTASKYISTQ